VTGSRRFSQAISEGDGISLIARVRSPDEARAAEDAGAEGVAIAGPVGGLRESTGLPVLWRTGGAGAPGSADADACVLGPADGERHEQVLALGLEPVVEVRHEEELELVLEQFDPEIFLLLGDAAEDDEEPLDRVLSLLPDLPAGKLAIAEVEVATREDVVALERAGVDAVLVEADRVGGLVGGVPPEV
jgi:NAD(P)H-dependent flavin oxidoreductase YrpB (nitropropane dioxygenase family)